MRLPPRPWSTGLKRRLVEELQAFHPGRGEDVGARQADLDLVRAEIANVEQFDIRIQRLVERRMQGDVPTPRALACPANRHDQAHSMTRKALPGIPFFSPHFEHAAGQRSTATSISR